MKRLIGWFALVGLVLTIILAGPIVNHFRNASEPFSEMVADLSLPVEEKEAGVTFPVAGQEPEPEPAADLKLHAPDIIQVGELVRLSAKESTVEGIIWQIIPYTEDFEVIENGRRAFLTARPDGPGEYLLIVAGAKAGVPYLKHHQIIVDQIDIQPGPTTLAAKIRGWLRAVEEHEGKEKTAQSIANVFRRLAVKEETGVDEILDATANANGALIGEENIPTWLPFLKPLGEELDIYIENGELETRDQFREVWLLIAAGIDRVYPPSAEMVEIESDTELAE